MTQPNYKFQRYTYPLILQQIPAAPLARFLDCFKDDLLAKNCRLPSAPPGSDGYCNCWAELLKSPETLPDSLVQAMGELVEHAAPANWPRLEAAVYQSIPAGSGINTGASRESLALQLWLWSRDQKSKQELTEKMRVNELSVDRGTAPLDSGTSSAPSESPPSDVAPVSKPAASPTSKSAEPETVVCAPTLPAAEGLETCATADREICATTNRGTKSIGKIARVPREIREQLNRRLEAGEEAKVSLEWLNGLPEVQTLLAAEFGGRPVSKQNLSEWKQNGFRNWQTRQLAIDFAQNLDADQAALPSSFSGALTEKLAHWVALRYAAVAQALTGIEDDPEAELRRLRAFCSDIVALRRGDLCAGRLGIEQARLAAEHAETDTQKETEFWAWTNRPDIQAKLYPKRDNDQIRREVVRMLDRELLGIRDPMDEQSEPDPAILI